MASYRNIPLFQAIGGTCKCNKQIRAAKSSANGHTILIILLHVTWAASKGGWQYDSFSYRGSIRIPFIHGISNVIIQIRS